MATISFDLSATSTWPSTSRCLAAKAETMWIGALPLFLWPERREVLPSMATTFWATTFWPTTSRGAPVRLATQATKQRWKASASSEARMSPRWSCDGVPSANGWKRRSRASFLSPKRAMSVIVSAPASTARSDRRRTLTERVGDLAALARIGQVPEEAQERGSLRERSAIPCSAVHRRHPRIEPEDHDRFSTSAPLSRTSSPRSPCARPAPDLALPSRND